MDRVSQILPAVLQKRGIKQHVDASLVIHRASAWIAENLPTLKTLLTPTTLQEDGTLIIECDHSSAAQECQAALPHLKVFLREECGFAPVRSIHLLRTRKRVSSI